MCVFCWQRCVQDHHLLCVTHRKFPRHRFHSLTLEFSQYDFPWMRNNRNISRSFLFCSFRLLSGPEPNPDLMFEDDTNSFVSVGIRINKALLRRLLILLGLDLLEKTGGNCVTVTSTGQVPNFYNLRFRSGCYPARI